MREGAQLPIEQWPVKKYNNYIINDIDAQLPQLFYDAVMGKFANEKTWISRDLFEMLKENDAYVRYIWSFGNNGHAYLYGREVEDIRCAYWNCVMADDLSECKKNISVLLKLISDKAIEIKNQLTVEWGTLSFPVKDLQALESLQRLQSLQKYCGSYKDVPIKNNSVIYCDIPYYETASYVCGDFDHEEFYQWAESQSQPVFISEYYMPEDRFTCIAEIEKRVLLGDNKRLANEKIFVPKHQEYNSKLTLF